MSTVHKQKDILLAVCVYLLLFFSFSYYSKNVVRELVNTALSALVVFIVYVFYNRKLKIEGNTILFVIPLVILGLLSSFLAGDGITMVVSPMINLVLAVFLVSSVSFERFRKAYINVVSVVCVLSIIAEFLYFVCPSVLTIFPLLKNTSGNYVRNLWVIVAPDFGVYRLQGFAWEPGVFQFIINVAIFFLLSTNMWNKKNKVIMVVLVISLLLTLSTTGYLVGGFVFFLFGLRKYEEKKISFAGLFKVLGLACVLIGLAMFFIALLPNTIGGASFGFSKILEFFKGSSSADHIDSASVRYDSIYYPFVAFLNSPIFGIGYTGLKGLSVYMHHDMTTCTPINYFAIYGFFYGAIVFVLIYRLCARLTAQPFKRVLFFLGFLVAISSEQFVNYLFLDILICFGACVKTEVKKNEIVMYK